MSEKKTLPPQWDRFLKGLTNKLSKPSLDFPSVRCLTKKNLASLFSETHKNLGLPSTFPSGSEILKLLSSMGLASSVSIETEKSNTPSKEFYLIGISESHSGIADPLELLQAYKTDGVICYFSALSYYELTTQFPTHHHIATITDAPSKSKIDRPYRNQSTPSYETAKESSEVKLGTLAFHYEETPFYTTKRRRNTIPGIKNRNLNAKTIIRITSKEQTLLDTLNYPRQCGGAEVIFEAWKNELGRCDEQVLIETLQKIDSASLARRLGTLIDFLGHTPGKELLLFLENTKKEMATAPELFEIPLLKGYSYPHLNSDWKIFTP